MKKIMVTFFILLSFSLVFCEDIPNDTIAWYKSSPEVKTQFIRGYVQGINGSLLFAGMNGVDMNKEKAKGKDSPYFYSMWISSNIKEKDYPEIYRKAMRFFEEGKAFSIPVLISSAILSVYEDMK